MKKTANARFSIKSWDEKPYSEGNDLPKMTRASVDRRFTGDIDGEGHVEYVMMYRSDGTAAFVGLERITGRIAGRKRQLRASAHGRLRRRPGQGILLRRHRLGDRRTPQSARRGHLLGRSCGRLSIRVELRTGLDTKSHADRPRASPLSPFLRGDLRSLRSLRYHYAARRLAPRFLARAAFGCSLARPRAFIFPPAASRLARSRPSD